MEQQIAYQQQFEIRGKDFVNAGLVSIQIKRILKEIGINSGIIYRTAICCYEAEMNIVMYANRGVLDFTVTPETISLTIKDEGPGIENIELAMQEGYSTATEEMREMGFGAGMGLPNIKNNADEFKIESEVGKGTKLFIKIYLNHSKQHH